MKKKTTSKLITHNIATLPRDPKVVVYFPVTSNYEIWQITSLLITNIRTNLKTIHLLLLKFKKSGVSYEKV